MPLTSWRERGVAEMRRSGEFPKTVGPRAPRLAARAPPDVTKMAPDGLGLRLPQRRKRKLLPDDMISTLEAIERLGALQATQDETAQFLGVSQPTLTKRFAELPEFRMAWERGRSIGKMALRRLLWAHALRPSASGVAAAIHLSKQPSWLGYGERQAELNETENHCDDPQELLAQLSDDELAQLIAIKKRIA
jgi:hypothetical protein